MKKIFIILFFAFALKTSAQSTLQAVVNGWNYIVTTPVGYNANDVYPTLIFFPGIGEIGTDVNKLKIHGPHAYPGIADDLPGWIIISLQPVTAYPSAGEMNIRLNSLKQLYKIDADKINLTGLSHGGWCAVTLVQNQNLNARTLITVQGVQPGNTTNFFPDTAALRNFVAPYLCFEQQNDVRNGSVIVNYLNTLHPGQAKFIPTFFGNSGHCCFGFFYGNASTMPSFFSELSSQTIYLWLIQQNNFTTVSLPVNPAQQLPFVKDFVVSSKIIHLKSSKYGGYLLADLPGRIVLKGNLKPGKNLISLANYPAGIYFFKTYFFTQKIVLQ